MQPVRGRVDGWGGWGGGRGAPSEPSPEGAPPPAPTAPAAPMHRGTLGPELGLHLLASPNYTQTIECHRTTCRTWQTQPWNSSLSQSLSFSRSGARPRLVKLSLLSEPALQKRGSGPAGSQPQLPSPEVHLKVAMPVLSDRQTHTRTHTPARQSELGGRGVV